MEELPLQVWDLKFIFYILNHVIALTVTYWNLKIPDYSEIQFEREGECFYD